MSEWKKVFETNISLYCRIIIQYLIESGWKSISIDEYTKKMPDFPVKNAVQSKLYKKEGLFPIVSQSKDLISGFSDEEQLLNKISKPIIIFGDHTQVVKYIDFDFVLGADGTKILTVTNDYNPKFIYYLIKSIDLHSNKYARHYSKLRKEKIPFQENSLAIQHKIASFLDSLENNNISNESYFDKETEKKILSLQKNSLNIQRIEKEIESQKNYIKQLRQNILQEAIEGKLTADWRKQNPVQKGNPDYDAEALFEQIQKKRSNEKKQKKLSPITDEEKPFEIPGGWKWVRLGEIINLLSGRDFEPSEYNDKQKGTPYITGASNFGENGIKINRWTESPRCIAKFGDLLLVCKGSGYGTLAYADFKEAHIARQVMSITTVSEFISLKYIEFILRANFQYLKTQGKGLIPGIDRETVLNICAGLPSLMEQGEIVTIVEKHLQTVSTLESQITEREQLAKQLMQSILKDAFEGERI